MIIICHTASCTREIEGLTVLGGTSKDLVCASREPIITEFVFHNSQDFPIEVQRVVSGCSCVNDIGDGVIIAPGDEMAFPFRIKGFSPFARRFRKSARVFTDAGEFVLEVNGTLPPSTTVLARPREVFLPPAHQGKLTRFIRIRVPVGCASGGPPICEASGGIAGLLTVSLASVETGSSDFVDWALNVTVDYSRLQDSNRRSGNETLLTVVSGCDTLELPVYFDSEGN